MMTTQAGSRVQAQWRLHTMSSGLRVVLADGDDARIREAAHGIAETGVTPVLVTSEPVTDDAGIDYLDPREVSSPIRAVLDDLVDRQSRKREMSSRERADVLADPLLHAVAAVKAGLADGCVAGATRPSADVARAALRIIGMAADSTTLSSSFLMVLPDGRALSYGDCAVVPEPDAEQLAEIAIATADSYAALVSERPIVAMLSFSTKGSAQHGSVDVVREATRIASIRRPELLIDGELQFDAAIVSDIASSKAPESLVAGRANVFIFPNLAAGNIAYKITERLAGADAFGPLFQGLAAPINDLSRGCSAQDVLNISVITGMQALSSRTQSAVGGE